MKRIVIVAAVALGVALLPGPATVRARGTGHAGGPVIASASAVITAEGGDLVVDVIVVASDQDHADAEAQAALHRRYPSAAPLGTKARGGSGGYTVNGLNWTAQPVLVNYNDAGSPLTGALSDLTAAMQTWTDVPSSSFAYAYGGGTARCPSLVDECAGRSYFDGHNDVGWIDLADPSLLAITWWGTKTPEFDIAIDNANYAWLAGCTSNYSLQTTLLHELGHALGLGHSKDPGSIMYATYLGPRCALGPGDVQGVTALYP